MWLNSRKKNVSRLLHSRIYNVYFGKCRIVLTIHSILDTLAKLWQKPWLMNKISKMERSLNVGYNILEWLGPRCLPHWNHDLFNVGFHYQKAVWTEWLLQQKTQENRRLWYFLCMHETSMWKHVGDS